MTQLSAQIQSVPALIDTHCHLDPEHLGEELEPVLERAKAQGVMALITIGVGEMSSVRAAHTLAQERPNIVAAIGVHPHDAAEHNENYHTEIMNYLSNPKVVAVGEVGLDYHYDHSPREIQAEVFRRFIHIAKAVQKPLVIHTRSAAEDTLAILEQEGARDVGGVIHCFSEDRAFAARALDMNFDLSFSGILTFKSAKAIQDAAVFAPASRILVETDSPYLAPVPLRGKRCEPAYVFHTAQFLASLRGVAPSELFAQTTENACRRFGPALSQALAAGAAQSPALS